MPPTNFNIAPQSIPPHPKKHFNIWIPITIVEFILIAILAGLLVWAYTNYIDQKENVDNKIAVAVSANTFKVKTDEYNKYVEKEKEPNREFVGPADFGRVTFEYPKTWSVYVNKDGVKGGAYEAYLNPITVPTVSKTQQFAIRVLIEPKDSAKVIADYNDLVEKGDLKAKSVKVGGAVGTRISGSFTKDIRGSAVIFKIRDKTLTIRTDANTFIPDFNKLITTIKFIQ